MNIKQDDITLDDVWGDVKTQAQALADKEPVLCPLLERVILSQQTLEEGLAIYLADKISNQYLSLETLQTRFRDVFSSDKTIGEAILADILAFYMRDPACKHYLTAILFLKGFHALQCYRLAHKIYLNGSHGLALHIQSRVSEIFGVDIHPAARIGKGLMLDHATSIVIGETAQLGDDVSILHGVTLGGTGKALGDRHPKIGRGVLLSVGVKVLGNITIGECAKIGAGSLVLKDIPPFATAVGIPAKVVGKADNVPALSMDHSFDI